MRIALEGKHAVLSGDRGEIGDALAAALAGCGAVVGDAGATASAAPYLLVNLPSQDDAADLERYAALTRAFASSAERVINVISAAGLVPIRGTAARSARQAALASLTRSLAMELAPRTLVNALAVGAVTGDPRMVSHTALRRAGTPAEVVTAALFLADPANSYTTGHVMAVDGGWSIGYARNF